MSTVIRNRKIECDEDCRQQGCPGHEMELTFQTTSNIYNFKKDGKSMLCIDRSTMSALLGMLSEMTHRIEVHCDLLEIRGKKGGERS